MNNPWDRKTGVIRLLTAGVWTALIAVSLAAASPMMTFAQTTEPAIESAPAAATAAEATANPAGDENILDNDTSAQTGSPGGPAISATVEVSIQNRFNELRRELLDDRGNTIDWWLAVIAIVLTFFGIVVAIAGFLGFSRFREIERQAKASVETATRHAEAAKRHVEEIERNREQSEKMLQRMTAQAAADDPAQASQTVEDVRENPRASLIDKAIADAIDLQRRGENEKAFEKWRAIANITEGSKNDLAARAWSSIAYLTQDKSPKDGILAYDQAIRLKPDLVEAYNNRGNAKGALGRHEAAIADHDEAIRLKPDLAVAYSNRGAAKAALGRHDDAVADYDEAIRLKPDLAGAYNNRGNAKRALGQHEAAIADHNGAIRLKPDYAGAYNNRGNAKAALGLKEEARKDFETALNLARKAGDAIVTDAAEQALRDLDADGGS